ncbi:cytochrome P450 [Gymnopus androsaceus JB14]|uniref:Cytochrome P450 n=1 Tax=Gymnopus androsaceus JB14 TaxID=1447944 RepID=A0A6A4GJS4_9AGAR|nr:cytochrome P450 [Gymnopus androsaceus JB14]
MAALEQQYEDSGLTEKENTMISLSWLLYAMTLYLEAQRTGQDEVDRVVGRGRVPDFGDMEDLVYVQALIKEILRWQPAGPLGFPHHLTESSSFSRTDVFLSREINRDREIYSPDADEFLPERNPTRAYPGISVAKNSLFIDLSMILWALNIELVEPEPMLEPEMRDDILMNSESDVRSERALYSATAGLGILILLRWSERYTNSRQRFSAGDHPKTKLWFTFGKFSREFGPLVYLNLAGQDVVVLNNRASATELLDRRSAIYSDRPKTVVLEHLGAPYTVFLTSYGKTLQAMRRTMHSVFNPQVSKDYYQVQADEATLLAHDLLSLSPEQSIKKSKTPMVANIERSSASAIVSIIYGMPPLTLSDPMLSSLNSIAARFTHASLPGAFLVELLPILDWIPSWTGMAKWKSDAKRDHKIFDETFRKYYKDSVILIVTWSNSLAGGETTMIALSWLIYAMTLYPEVQARGQEEIDRVVGRGRIPNFGDMEELVYVQAMVREVIVEDISAKYVGSRPSVSFHLQILRWQPVIPLGLPHRLMEVHFVMFYSPMMDDWYEGYLIPKGTACMPNIWEINRDLDIYGPDAADFRPERFIEYSNSGAPKIRSDLGGPEGHYTFGFGRRICPGMNVANNALFIDTCMILWALNVELEPESLLKAGIERRDILNQPPHFECKWTARFADTESMLQEMRNDILNVRRRSGGSSFHTEAEQRL